MLLQISHVVWLAGVMLAVSRCAVSPVGSQLPAGFVTNSTPLTINVAKAADSGTSLPLISKSNSTLIFTANRPTNCLTTDASANSVEISFGNGPNCSLPILWSVSSYDSKRYIMDAGISLSTTSDVRFQLGSKSVAKYKDKRKAKQEELDLICDGIWTKRDETEFVTELIVKRNNASCHEILLQFTADVNQDEVNLDEELVVVNLPERNGTSAERCSASFLVVFFTAAFVIGFGLNGAGVMAKMEATARKQHYILSKGEPTKESTNKGVTPPTPREIDFVNFDAN